MEPKKFIVTGANGFLGSNLVEELLREGHTVQGLILDDNQWSKNMKHENLILQKLDVTDVNQLNTYFSTMPTTDSIIIHTAGIVSISSTIDENLTRVNVSGTKNVIDSCMKYGCARFVYISSVHAIPELPGKQTMTEVQSFSPESVNGGYAKTKAIASQLVVDARKSGLKATIVHPSGMIGPGDWGNGNVKQAIIDYLNHKLTAMVNGGYDFVDVRDVAKGIVSASTMPVAENQNYILGGSKHTMRQIISIVDEIMPERKHKLTMLPFWFISPMAAMAEIWYKLRKVPPTFTRYSIDVLRSNSNFDCRKAKTDLDYSARDIHETLEDAVKWYRDKGFIKK